MTETLGRPPDARDAGPTCSLGRFLAPDGSTGAPVELDLDRPHVATVVGKRGTGKSYTLGVLAEGLAAAPGVTGVVVDPMGVFAGLASAVPAADDASVRVLAEPRVRADEIPPPAWCDLLDVDRSSAAGSLLWRAVDGAGSLAAVREAVDAADAPAATRRAVRNHLELAADWDVFDPTGLAAEDLLAAPLTVLDCSGLGRRPLAALVRAVAAGLYDARVARRDGRAEGTDAGAGGALPWLLVDEAHALADSVAWPALRTLLTRGRQPGASLALATQRPSALPDVAVSQTDLLLAHHLTSAADVEALSAARPTYLEGTVADRLPSGTGEVLVVDDATECTYTVRVRERETEHGGDAPRAGRR